MMEDGFIGGDDTVRALEVGVVEESEDLYG
jgi:hypothetical protein